jgi:hypothetical protein
VVPAAPVVKAAPEVAAALAETAVPVELEAQAEPVVRAVRAVLAA